LKESQYLDSFFAEKPDDDGSKEWICFLCPAGKNSLTYDCKDKVTGRKSHLYHKHYNFCTPDIIKQMDARKEKLLPQKRTHSAAFAEEAGPSSKQQAVDKLFGGSGPALSGPPLFEAIATAICIGFLAISSVYNKGIIYLLAVLAKLRPAAVPSRWTIARTVKRMFTEKREDIVQKLAAVPKWMRFSSSTDCWTSRSMKPFLGIRMQWIDNDWRMQSHSLAIKPLPHPHTAANIAKAYTDAAAEYNVNGWRMATRTTDNGKNMWSPFDYELQITQIACASHTLQLPINGSLEDECMVDFVDKHKTFARTFTTSSKRQQALSEALKKMNMRDLKAVNPSETRWNGTERMCRRNYQILDAAATIDPKLLYVTAKERQQYSSMVQYLLSMKQLWVLISPLLALCAVWTQVWSGNGVTISLVRKGVITIRKAAEEVKARASALRAEASATRAAAPAAAAGGAGAAADGGAAQPRKLTLLVKASSKIKALTTAEKFATVFLENLGAYFRDEVINHDLYEFAELIDPRTTLFTGNRSKQRLDTLFNEAWEYLPESYRFPVDETGAASAGEVVDGIEYDGDADLGGVVAAADGQLGALEEKYRLECLQFRTQRQEWVSKIRQEPQFKAELENTDPLQWWKKNEKQYPELSKVVRIVLSMPATSADTERLFSRAGLVMTDRRASLLSENFEKLLLLHDWLLEDKNVLSKLGVRQGNVDVSAATVNEAVKVLQQQEEESKADALEAGIEEETSAAAKGDEEVEQADALIDEVLAVFQEEQDDAAAALVAEAEEDEEEEEYVVME
jgi:hypothetical protein